MTRITSIGLPHSPHNTAIPWPAPDVAAQRAPGGRARVPQVTLAQRAAPAHTARTLATARQTAALTWPSAASPALRPEQAAGLIGMLGMACTVNWH